MNGGDNTLTPHLKSLKNAAWAKYAKERAVAEKDKRNMNNIKRRHPGLVRNLGANFAAVSGNGGPASASSENALAPKALAFRKSRKSKSKRRQRKTRRQRK